jgi:hypothetical protein
MQGDENLGDPGMLYRTLRQFEQEGLVTSSWDTSGHGPARRVYQITDAGHKYLEWWIADRRKARAQLDQFLAEYESVVATRSLSHQRAGAPFTSMGRRAADQPLPGGTVARRTRGKRHPHLLEGA